MSRSAGERGAEIGFRNESTNPVEAEWFTRLTLSPMRHGLRVGVPETKVRRVDQSLSGSQRRRVDLAEGLAYETLYRVAAPVLKTGSARLGDVTLIWHPNEDEAGYNCLVNFHLATDPEVVFQAGVEILRSVGSNVIGVPIDSRVAGWATREKIASTGLEYQSDEVIWGRKLRPDQFVQHPETPDGIDIVPDEIGRDELALLINVGWGLEPDDPRGILYSHAPEIPGWKTYLAMADREVAGVSIYCSYEQVGLLMLAIVLPHFRGRGLQSYFIAERLAESAARGCTLAISETNDDNASPRNLQRAGFQHWVTRRIFKRSI